MIKIGYNYDMYILNPYIYGGAAAFTNDYSLQFDGVDEYVSCGNIGSFAGSILTTSFWFKYTGTLSTTSNIMLSGGISGSNDFYIQPTSSTNIRYGHNSTLSDITVSSMTINTWYHLFTVHNGSNLEIWLNGVSQGTASGITSPGTGKGSNFRIADYWNVGGYNFNGFIDEVAIWNTDKSADVSSIYNSGSPSDLDAYSPNHWWRMGDGDTFSTNWTINDVGTTGGNDGTSANMEEIDRVCGVNPTGFCNDYSLVFDGVDELVSAGSVSELNNVQNFSVSCWVKKENNNGYDGVWGKYFDSNDCTFLWFNGSNLEARMSNGSLADNKYTFSTALNTWYHLVVVYDGTQSTNETRLKLYVDGTELTRTSGTGTIPSTTSATASSFEIGQVGVFVTDRSFDGNIDEVGFFDYSLTSGQVTSLYNSGVPTDLDSTSGVTAPVHWWRMGDGSDTISTIYDVGTSASNNGTPQNMEAGDFTNDRPI